MFITTSISGGQVVTSAPYVVTETIISTNSQGFVTTITQAYMNPSLVPNTDPTKTSSFFSNTGAVVGVFVVVGLAAASIFLWILFAIRRRHRQRRIDQDTAVEAAVAAAGFGRAPLDDDNDRGGKSPHTHSQFSSEMGQRSSLFGYIPAGTGSSPTGPKPMPGPYDDYAAEEPGHFNPYAEYLGDPGPPPATRDGYVPARTASPPPGASRISTAVDGVDEFGDNSRERNSSYGHTPTYSAGSYEPLLAAYAAQTSAQPENNRSPPTPPPRNPQRHIDNAPGHADEAAQRDSTAYASDDTDDRLDPDMLQRTKSGSLGSVDLRDEEDYSRPVLKVSNG
ncbi:hypothetical protein BJ138DRAFT_995763 [Hygrophoropsis aurantiaca]|uniref:Uncharacterized protein n=1 Tax=Hygrophoropsis aurantiaca TaxID=72124 RepID=A0ACB8ASZ3_9AGAM|nr:hypothetical protein BJ138DRAFT_995763 [Hygrophoropsis aurantiaca]